MAPQALVAVSANKCCHSRVQFRLGVKLRHQQLLANMMTVPIETLTTTTTTTTTTTITTTTVTKATMQ